jgi:alpha-glucosidase
MEKILVTTSFLLALVIVGHANTVDQEIKPTIRLEKNKEWWEYTKFYQIYPRSFKDGNGDGIGDFIGITSHLEHLVETGVNTIWLSPCFTSPQVDLGYDVSNFFEIHPEYGTMEDFEAFLDKAHNLDLKVLLDFVPNHSSDQHQWFIDSENMVPGFEDYYVWRNASALPIGGDPVVPNNWVSVFGGPAWTWSTKREQFYLHQFTSGQPDLNYRNPVVLEEMNKVLLFWLDKGADGFRLDAINHMFEDELFRDEEETGWTTDPNSYDFLHHYYTKDVVSFSRRDTILKINIFFYNNSRRVSTMSCTVGVQ